MIGKPLICLRRDLRFFSCGLKIKIRLSQTILLSPSSLFNSIPYNSNGRARQYYDYAWSSTSKSDDWWLSKKCFKFFVSVLKCKSIVRQRGTIIVLITSGFFGIHWRRLYLTGSICIGGSSYTLGITTTSRFSCVLICSIEMKSKHIKAPDKPSSKSRQAPQAPRSVLSSKLPCNLCFCIIYCFFCL